MRVRHPKDPTPYWYRDMFGPPGSDGRTVYSKRMKSKDNLENYFLGRLIENLRPVELGIISMCIYCKGSGKRTIGNRYVKCSKCGGEGEYVK